MKPISPKLRMGFCHRLWINIIITIIMIMAQAMEMHKRKAIESAQSAADLKLHLEKYHSQIKEVLHTIIIIIE